MSSAFHHIFKFDNSGTIAGHASPGGDNESPGFCPQQAIADTDNPTAEEIAAGNISKTFILPSDANDFAVCNIASGCDCRVAVQMSPDNETWCDCYDSAFAKCNNIVCLATSGSCNCKIINAPMLQYVRVVLFGGVSEDTETTSAGKGIVSIHWTTF